VPLFSVAKRTLPFLDAFALGTVRYAIGVALLIALLVAVEGRQALRFDGRLRAASGVGMLGITGFNLFIWIGLMFTRPEHASIILALQTPLTALAVWLVRGQRPAAFTLGCVVVAIGGVLLVVTRGEPARALAEFRRVLKPGGIVCILEITRPESRIGTVLLKGYLRGVVPALAWLLARSADSPRLMRYYWDTIEACVPPRAVAATLADAGFVEVTRHVELGVFSEYRAVVPPAA